MSTDFLDDVVKNVNKEQFKKKFKIVKGDKKPPRKKAKGTSKSPFEDLFLEHWEEMGLAARYTLEKEYKFHTERGWRFDFAVKSLMLAIEIEGGTWQKGRHTSGVGYREDLRKYNEAQRLNWAVYRFTTDDVNSGYAIDYMEKLLRDFIPSFDDQKG